MTVLKQQRAISIAVVAAATLAAILISAAATACPPHPDLVERIAAGKTAAPWFLVHRQDVRNMDRRLLLKPTALRVAPARPDVAIDHVHALDQDKLLLRHHPQDLTPFALVSAGDDLDYIIPSYVTSHLSVSDSPQVLPGDRTGPPQTTSSAREMIFM